MEFLTVPSIIIFEANYSKKFRMEFNSFKTKESPLQEINDPLIMNAGIRLYVKREDLIHSSLSGNKFYKLKYNLIEAKKNKFKTILSFGGAYSNHIYALASAGKFLGFNTIGIIRGEEHLPLNPTLQHAVECGMHLHYMNRKDYRKKNEEGIISRLKNKFGSFYLLPEGGSNELAVKGCSEILKDIEEPFGYVAVPCGTGGTLAGIISSLGENKYALGFAVLKGASFLKKNVASLLKDSNKSLSKNWDINLDYHFGGYAKFNKQLVEFCRRFEEINNIPIEPIYSGKMFFGIYDLIAKGFIKNDQTIIAIHTGGLQGFNETRYL